MFSLITYFSCVAFILTYCTTLQAAADADVEFTTGKARFGNSIYSLFAKDPGNILFSPLGLHELLSLLYYGSAGSTKTALKSALGTPEVLDTAVAYKSTIDHLKKSTNVILEMATKIYAHNSVNLVNKFKTDSEYYFDSDIELVNFDRTQAAIDKINKWVADKTHNKIKDLLQPDHKLGATIVMILLNALYFDGVWMTRFHLLPTKLKFYSSKTYTIDCSMIQQTSQLEYKIDLGKGYQFVRIPYVDKEYSLSIILPNEKHGLADLEKKFASDRHFFDLRGTEKKVQVMIPRFKIEKEIDFKPILRQLGLDEIFKKLDIPNMIQSSGGLIVDQVKQKAYFDVNENGTVAAAATEVTIKLLSTRGDPEAYVTADHPFMFLLEAMVGNVRHVLFQGRVINPEYQ